MWTKVRRKCQRRGPRTSLLVCNYKNIYIYPADLGLREQKRLPVINHTIGLEERLCLVRKNRIPNHTHKTNLSVSAVLSETQTIVNCSLTPGLVGIRTPEVATPTRLPRGQILTSQSSYSAQTFHTITAGLLSGRRGGGARARRAISPGRLDPINP